MSRKADWTIQSIDLLGGAIVVGLVAVTFWLAFVEGDRIKTEVSELRELLRSAEQDRIALQVAQQKQLDLLLARQHELDQTGHFPARPPVESYFQFLSRRAADHGLSVLRHHPLAERRYPGLTEHCFAYDVSGDYPAIARFLRDIEESEHWADVGFLKIDRGPLLTTAENDKRVAQLTISLFSAPPVGSTKETG